MEDPLAGRVALVTGAARNIGRAIAEALAADGAAIGLHARASLQEAEETAARIVAGGGRCVVVPGDLGAEAGVNQIVRETHNALGPVDILVNTAGTRGWPTPFAELTYAAWRDVFAASLDGAFFCARAVIPAMVERGWGRIINFDGIAAHTGAPQRAAIIAAKMGVVGLTKALAAEFVGRGVTVNSISPGPIETIRVPEDALPPGLTTPVGRFGTPAEVAEAVRWLCGPGGGFVTGQVIHVNGGAYSP